jgi:transcription-repair coupling factor (superfamily II helicase)
VPSSTHDWKAAIRALADDCQHPSSATRRLIEQLATGDAIGVDVYAPAFHAALAPVAAYLPADATWLWWDPDATLAAIDGELAAADAGYAERRAHKQLAFPPAAHYVDRAAVVAQLASQPRRVVLPALTMIDDPRGAGAEVIAVAIDPLARLRTELERARVQHDDHLGDPLTRAIALARADGTATVVIAADSAQRADRLHGLLEGHGLAADRVERLGVADAVQLMVAPLSQSFASAADGLLAIAAGDVFGKKHHGPRQKSASKRAKDALLGGVGDFAQLAPGDFLVHSRPRRRSLPRPARSSPLGGTEERACSQLEYLGGDKLYLPVVPPRRACSATSAPRATCSRASTSSAASPGTRPKASVAAGGCATWRASCSRLYARAPRCPGTRFSAARSLLPRVRGGDFAYEETPDQRRRSTTCSSDMERGEADGPARLRRRRLRQDRGRDARRVQVRAGRQAGRGAGADDGAGVSSTSRNVPKRFAATRSASSCRGFLLRPSELATSSKARATGQARRPRRHPSPAVEGRALQGSRAGRHRRGAALRRQSEGALKALRANVDVLTLTATPIPRTLHMAMTGMRDLSRHRDAAGRSPRDSYVRAGFDPQLIKERDRLRELRAAGRSSSPSTTASALDRCAMHGERSTSWCHTRRGARRRGSCVAHGAAEGAGAARGPSW